MKKRMLSLVSLVVMVALLLVVLGCATPAPKAAPTSAPSPAPSPSAAPKPAPTTAPAPAPTATAAAKPMELKGVLWKTPATGETMMGRALMSEIEKRSNGLLKFKILGGSEVVPSLEQPEAVRKAVVDWSWVAAAYSAGFVPESNAHTLMRMDNKKARELGIDSYLKEIYQKQGLYYVTNLDPSDWEQFLMFFLTKPIEKPEDMKGVRMRSTSILQPVIQAFGGVPISMPLEDSYIALDRGLIQGMPQTIPTVFDFKLNEILKYYVIPGFGHSQIVFLMNLGVWNSIPANLQKMINDTLIEMEPEYAKKFLADWQAGIARLDAAGMKKIQLSREDGERMVSAYYDANWKTILNQSTVNGPKLRSLAGLPPLTK